MLNRQTRRLVALTLLVSLCALGSISTPAAAQPLERDFRSAQVADPFQEIESGVYLYWNWWNESSEDWNMTYYYDGDWQYYYGVEDIYGNYYVIDVTGSGEYDYRWDFSNLLVTIIVDPDASYIDWLSTYEGPWDVWMIYWAPEPGAMSGDEVFVYSNFYYSYWYSYWSYSEEYTWYNSQWEVVDPYSVVPLLQENYSWASYFVESYNYTGGGEYRSFGYDVSEMLLRQDRTEWMNHYFSGLSVFNDTNANGIMDMVYSEYPVDYDYDGITDYTYTVLNTTLSEHLYDFYSNNASLGEVVTPYINDDGQLEWSAEVVDIGGVLTSGYPVLYIADATRNSEMGMAPEVVDYGEYVEIPASLDSMKLTYKFEVSSDAVTLKIDQYIGDFTDPVTHEILAEAQGLSLAINYWSSFSSYENVPVTGAEPGWTDVTYPMSPEQSRTEPVSAIEVPDGSMNLDYMSKDFLDIEFGGTYVWGSDGGIYDVGTAVYPQYIYPVCSVAAPSSSDLMGGESWSYASYYYSSCYSKWDGHSITHDPVYRLYPNVAPGSISNWISAILTSSVLLGSVGVVMIGVICALGRNERLAARE